MADIVIKNGYNGFDNKGHNPKKFSKTLLSFKNRLPPLPNDKSSVVSSERGLHSPFLQGSLSDHSNTDIVILLDDELKRIRQLSNNLGINQRYEIAQYHNRFHGLKQGRLPQIESSKCWRQSHNWIKRKDNIDRHDTPKFQTGFNFKAAEKFSVDLDSLPKGGKKLLKPVDIPSLGCSYRLPIPKEQKQRTTK